MVASMTGTADLDIQTGRLYSSRVVEYLEKNSKT